MLTTSVWLGQWLRGSAAADDLVAALERLAPDAPATPLLPLVRATGADRVWPVLPRPGRSLGWPPGVPGAPQPAVLLSAGPAVVGLVRCPPGGWRVDGAAEPGLRVLESEALGVRAAERRFAELVAGAAVGLERLALDRPAAGPATTAWDDALRRLPESLTPGAAALLRRVGSVLDALALALAEDGAAVTAGEAQARRDALRSLAGELADLLCGAVGGLNPLPVPWPGD